MIRLFHVSDVHFGCEDPAAIAWFDRLVQDEQPDAVVMTGDLTMHAKHGEYEAATAWLKGLGRPATVEVGNHDLPYFNLWARFVTPYKRFLALEQMVEHPLDVPGVSIVPLKTTARAQFRLDWSKGYVSDRALATTLDLIRAVPPGNLVFVACHHPLVDEGTRIGGRTRHGLKALQTLAAAGVHAVLSGHTHDPFDVPWQEGDWRVRLVGAGTLSKRTRRSAAEFNEIRIKGDIFHTIARSLSPEPDAVVTLDAATGRAQPRTGLPG